MEKFSISASAFFGRFISVFFIGVFFCCRPASADSNSSDRIKVGMILTLSGNFQSAGADGRAGIEAALAVIGPRPHITPVYGDSKNDPKSGISEFQRLLDFENVTAIYTHRGSIGMALNPLSLQSGIVLIGGVGNKDFAKQNRYAVQTWPKSDDEGSFVADDFIARGYKRAAIIYTEDDWPLAVSTAFKIRLAAAGGELLLDHSVLPSEHEFRSQLLQLKQARPDAVFFNVLLPQIGPLIKQARDLGITAIFYSNFYAAKKEVLDAGGKALNGVRFVEMKTDLPVMVSKLAKEKGAGAESLAISSYLALLLMEQAAADLPPGPSREQFYQAVISQKEIRTPDGAYPIEDRYVRFPLAIKEIENGLALPLR